MKETLLHLKQTLALIAAGEPSGPLGLLLIAAGFTLTVWMLSKAISALVEAYAKYRYLDAEVRRKWLEGDE